MRVCSVKLDFQRAKEAERERGKTPVPEAERGVPCPVMTAL